MPTGAQLLPFLFASAALVAVPGPAVAFIVARSVARGIGAGALAALGIALGNLAQALAAAAGLAAALAAQPLLYASIKYAGAAYLLFLGIQAFAARTRSRSANEPAIGASPAAVQQGFLVGLLNPKVALFLLAFLPQFARPEQGQVWLQLLLLGTLFVLVGWAGDTLWAIASGFAAERLRRASGGRWSRWITGIAYCSIALAVALGY